MGHRAGCRVGSTKSVRVPCCRPCFTWPPFCTLAGPANTHRARRRLSSSSNSNSTARRPSRAAQDMARGCAAAEWQQVTSTNTGPQDPQPRSPKGPHSRGPAGKRGMEGRSGKGGVAGLRQREGEGIGGGGPLVVMGGGREEETGPERTRRAFPPHSCKPRFPAHPPGRPCPPHRELKPLKTAPCPQTSL